MIDAEGKQVGIMETREALALAQESELDLVEVSPNAKPPVCRLMDYGKFKYEQNKKAKDARKRQHTTQLKEIKMGMKIDEHDYRFKLRHAENFLKHRDRVKMTVTFMGREVTRKEMGRELLERALKDLSHVCTIEGSIQSEGRNIAMILVPK